MALIETSPVFSQCTELQVDCFGLSIGSVSVGLPVLCTTETVLLRYLDLIRLIQRGPEALVEAPYSDVVVLAEATNMSPDQVVSRLRALWG